MVKLTLKDAPRVPLEAEVLSPDVIAGLSLPDIAALPVQHGKRRHRLDEFFTVEGEPGEDIEIHGEAQRVKWIGRGMSRGRITVHGDAGMHLGAYMKGGTIEVSGNASDWVGAQMEGGLIHVHGNAGGQIGAAYRGSPSGMNNGTIVIDGSAGLEVGARMKRGTIAIGETVRDFAGLQMKGGTIFLLGGAELRTGAWMFRGTIVSMKPIRLLPTFAYACSYNPTFLRLFAKYLARFDLTLPYGEGAGQYQRHTGDAAVGGRGEILIWATD